MSFALDKAIPTKRQFILNLEAKRKDTEYLGDTIALLRPNEIYRQDEAFDLVISSLVDLM
jgi:hypothetical protein